MKFSFKITPNKKYIVWKCTWNGKYHKDYGEPIHPFSNTCWYADELNQYNKLLEKFKRHKQKMIYEFTPRRANKKRMAKNDKLGYTDHRDMGDVFAPEKLTKEDIEKRNPIHMREIGDYVANNPATLAMCQLLKMDLKDLLNHCGNVDPYWYKMKLLAALCELWD